MSEEIVIHAEVRTDAGKGASRRLRRENKLPAVVYGGGGEAVSLTLDHNEMVRYSEFEHFYSQVLTLNTGDASEKVILRDLQRHPYKRLLMHMDFLRVREDQEVQVNLPIHFIGEDECVGVKVGGGAISHIETEILVSCLPKNLPEFLEVDLSQLELGESIHISDVTFPEGVISVDLTHGEDHDRAIASVHTTRVSKLDGEEEEDGAEDEDES